MRITCPACDTAYDVPETLLTPGRALRCARCRSQWIPVAAPEEPAPVVPPETTPEPLRGAAMLRASEPPMAPLVPPLRAARARVIAGWVLSFLALGATGYAAIAWRHPIERAWPPSVRAYAYIGYR